MIAIAIPNTPAVFGNKRNTTIAIIAIIGQIEIVIPNTTTTPRNNNRAIATTTNCTIT